MAPMTRYFSPNGIPGEDVARYYARRAEAGTGLIITEGTYIDHPSSGGSDWVPRLRDATADSWLAVVEEVHRHGGVIFPQLWHVGPGEGLFGTERMLSASGITGTGICDHRLYVAESRAMTVSDITAVIAAYTRSAALAKALGFDGIEIHGGHGYLIDSFLWHRTNARTDAFGQDPEGRSRFAVEIVKSIREEVGDDFPISFRFSQWKISDFDARIAETPGELADLLAPISAAGVSLFHASTRRFWDNAFPGSDRSLASWTKVVTGKPVIAVGSVGLTGALLAEGDEVSEPTDLDRLGRYYSTGEFDLIAVGRAVLANPDWVAKVSAGRSAELRAYTLELEDELI
jgi:2,4-dienoyl-CoA reductase-like NADH-dependent reductase (Old Yellow Enzyme family)